MARTEVSLFRPLFWWVGLQLSILAGNFAPQTPTLQLQNEKWSTPKNIEEKAQAIRQLPKACPDKSGLRVSVPPYMPPAPLEFYWPSYDFRGGGVTV